VASAQQQAIDKNKVLLEIARRARTRKLYREYANLYDNSRPFGGDNVGVYNWQAEFHNAGAKYAERLLLAANRTGKTRTGSAEVAMHLTGLYPPWWKGRRFTQAVTVWTGAERTEDSKDIVQEALLGRLGELGTGWLPGDTIVRTSTRQAGVPEVVEKIYVRHVSGGVSICNLKTYQQEAKGWRGKSVDLCWLDETVPMDIYTEALTRLLDRKGIMIVTFTPTEGPTAVVRHFLEGDRAKGIYVKNVTWDDAPHLDKDERERLWSSYPPHERETRAKGLPMLGTGAVFPIGDDDLTVKPMPIPPHWSRINGIDFGIDHPAAGVFCAWDKDADTFYVYDCYKSPGQTPVYHAAAMKKHGDWVPNAWPHDGMQRDKGSGIALKDMYRRHGLYMLKEHAHYPDERGNHREPGVIEMYEWMRTGRFKVFSTLSQWFEEKRLYHRKDGKIVDQFDDIMSATRMAFIMRRYAKTQPTLTARGPRPPRKPIVGGYRRAY